MATEIEEKSLKAQISLFDDIDTANNTLHGIIKDKAKMTLDVLNSGKVNDENTHITFTMEDFDKIRSVIYNLSSNDGFSKLNNYIKDVLLVRDEKSKLLDLLR